MSCSRFEMGRFGIIVITEGNRGDGAMSPFLSAPSLPLSLLIRKWGGDISWFSSLFEAAESPLESFASKQELIRRRYHCYLQRTHFLFLLCV